MAWVVRGRAGIRGVADRRFGDDSFFFFSSPIAVGSIRTFLLLLFAPFNSFTLVFFLDYVYNESTFLLYDSSAMFLKSVLARIEEKVNTSIARQRWRRSVGRW